MKSKLEQSLHWENLIRRDYGEDVDLEKELSVFRDPETFYNINSHLDFERAIQAVPFFIHENLPLPAELQSAIDGLLNRASQHGFEKWFEKAVKVGMDFSIVNRNSIHRVNFAILYGYERVFDFLVGKLGENAKILLNQPNNVGENAFQTAAKTKSDNPVFLEKICQLCGVNKIKTLLPYAAMEGNARCLTYLLSQGAELDGRAIFKNEALTAEQIIMKFKWGSEQTKYHSCKEVFRVHASRYRGRFQAPPLEPDPLHSLVYAKPF